MFYKNRFVINPKKGLVPNYNISPFDNNSIRLPFYYTDLDKSKGEEYISSVQENYIITHSGSHSIFEVLGLYNLQPNDIVTILTTSGNFYVSSCITNEIEKYCKWSREIEKDTKLIFVNNEFGYSFDQIKDLKSLQIPIVEDCAYGFFNDYKNKEFISDYRIFSFSKALPMQMGGMIVANAHKKLPKEKIDSISKGYIIKSIGYHSDNFTKYKDQRIKNYRYLCNKFNELELLPFFEFDSNIIPGVFLMKGFKNIDLQELKFFCQRNGIESSVFYGKNAFFIPIHQNLVTEDLDYFYEVIKEFISKKNS